MYRIVHYETPDGKDVFAEWRFRLRDRRVQIAVDRRLYRVVQGNLGDHRYCQSGVWELRLTIGPGYRIYYGLRGTELVVLLGAGDKSTQSADIARAAMYWKEVERGTQ